MGIWLLVFHPSPAKKAPVKTAPPPEAPRDSARSAVSPLPAKLELADYTNYAEQVVRPSVAKFIGTLQAKHLYFPFSADQAVMAPPKEGTVGIRTDGRIGPYQFSHYSQGEGVLKETGIVYHPVDRITFLMLEDTGWAGTGNGWTGDFSAATNAIAGLPFALNAPYNPQYGYDSGALPAIFARGPRFNFRTPLISVQYLSPKIPISQRMAWDIEMSVAAVPGGTIPGVNDNVLVLAYYGDGETYCEIPSPQNTPDLGSPGP